MFQSTSSLKKIAQMDKRIRVIQGGTSAGKTFAILMLLIQIAQTKPNKSISIVAESLPHLRKGAMRDFFTILRTHKYYNEAYHNKTEMIYNFENGSYVEFFGADDPSKLRGPRRDILFMNEANNMPFQTFDQLEVRTRNTVFIDFNPVSEFWAHTDVIPYMEHDFLILTYRDNEALEESIVKSIESRKDKPNWWRVYGLGEIGVKEGQVYDDWKHIDAIPEEATLVRRGLDFGYTNDPTALVDIYDWGKTDSGRRRFILKERLYRTGMKNREIAAYILTLPEPKMLVVADSAEPKSIDEIKDAGVKIMGAVKGPGSLNYGIDTVKDCEIYVTSDSDNIITEERNYLWKLDKDGKPLNVPEDIFNHALDSARYAISDIVGAGNKPKFMAASIN